MVDDALATVGAVSQSRFRPRARRRSRLPQTPQTRCHPPPPSRRRPDRRSGSPRDRAPPRSTLARSRAVRPNSSCGRHHAATASTPERAHSSRIRTERVDVRRRSARDGAHAGSTFSKVGARRRRRRFSFRRPRAWRCAVRRERGSNCRRASAGVARISFFKLHRPPSSDT